MTMNWSQEQYDCSTQVEREADRSPRVQSKLLVPRQTPQIDRSWTNRVEAESPPTAGYAKWKMWLVGWDVILAALAGMMIFFLLNVASLGVLGSAAIVAALVVAFGLGHYLLWGRRFERRVARERQRFQDRAGRPKTRETNPPDVFLLEVNDRERVELLQLLEHSLAATEGCEGREESAAVHRELQERVRMFGA